MLIILLYSVIAILVQFWLIFFAIDMFEVFFSRIFIAIMVE